jgi:hypothetical protein
MRDDTIVSGQALQEALDTLERKGIEATLGDLLQAEPVLGGYVTQNATLVAGKLALAGAPQSVSQGVHTDLLANCLLVYLAVRKGTFEIWKETALGEKFQEPGSVAGPGGQGEANWSVPAAQEFSGEQLSQD